MNSQFISELKEALKTCSRPSIPLNFLDVSKSNVRPRAFFTILRDSIPFQLLFPVDYPKLNNPEEHFFFTSRAEILEPWIELLNDFTSEHRTNPKNPTECFPIKDLLTHALNEFEVLFEQSSAKLEVPLRDSLQLNENEIKIEGKNKNSPAVKLLFRELKEINAANPKELGFSASLIDENLFHWEVNIKIPDYNSPLGKDLLQYEDRYGSDEIVLELKFDENYPKNPPFVRVIKPRFELYTGNISYGGSVCLELLTPQGWKSDIKVTGLIQQLISMFKESGARIDFSSTFKYTPEEALAAFSRTERLRQSSQTHQVGSFSQKIPAFPPVFVDRLELETFGSVLLPVSVAEAMTRTDSLSNPVFVELKSSKGAPLGVYMPTWMMKNLGIEDGEPVRVQVCDFPAASLIQLQPLTDEFTRLPNPKMFLQQGLGRLSVLQQGDTVSLFDKSSGKKFLFNEAVVTLGAGPTPLSLDILPPLQILSEEQRKKDLEENERLKKLKSQQREKKLPAQKSIKEAPTVIQTDKTKCWICDTKVRSILGIACKCGFSFCGSHRIPEQHACPFEYKSSAKQNLEETLVKIVSNKGLNKF